MKKTEKIVYKANTKLIKRILLGMLILFIACIFAKPVKNGVEYVYYNTWKNYDLSGYNLKFSLPRGYIEEEIDSDSSILNASAFTTDTNVKVNQEYVTQKPEVIYKGKNKLNGISLSVEYLNTEKTTRTLDEIAENYYTLIRIYYEDKYKIGEYKKEYVKVLDTDAVRVEVDMTVKENLLTFVTYLVPTDTREVTITFLGNSDEIDKNITKIEKIVSKFK